MRFGALHGVRGQRLRQHKRFGKESFIRPKDIYRDGSRHGFCRDIVVYRHADGVSALQRRPIVF